MVASRKKRNKNHHSQITSGQDQKPPKIVISYQVVEPIEQKPQVFLKWPTIVGTEDNTKSTPTEKEESTSLNNVREEEPLKSGDFLDILSIHNLLEI